MKQKPSHTLVGMAFIAVCLIIAGGLYAIIRTPPPTVAGSRPDVSNTSATLNTSVAIADSENIEAMDAVPASPEPGAKLGNCYGNECSWSKEDGRKIVRVGEPGQLVRLSLLGGTSNGDKGKIKWDRAPHDVYVFCSKVLPAVMMRTDRGWQTDVLTFTAGIPNVIVSSAEIYLTTCHPNDGENVFGHPTNYGYKDIPSDFEDVAITQPDEIFSIATRLASTSQEGRAM